MMMNDLKLAVTHFYRRSPNNRGWIQTDFITRIVGTEGDFEYTGIPKAIVKNNGEGDIREYKILSTPIDKNKIKLDILNGSLIELAAERIIEKSESIWIASDQSVYIANAYDPAKGRKELIYIDNISNVYSVINYIVRRLLNSDKMKTWKLC
ncbi:MAG: hypothetical protein JWR12_3086 [Mucilaginibacter sp.]|nr:hypothetical protein [Mucilaginibacter sp.]